MDYLQDEDDDLVIKNGDFVKIEKPFEQYKKDLLFEALGERKLRPLQSVNIFLFLGTDGSSANLNRKIKEVVKLDKGQVKNIRITRDEVTKEYVVNFDLTY